MRGGLRMKTFKTIASLLVGTVSSLLLMGCGEIDTGTETSAWEKETATIVPEEPKTEIILGDIGGASTLQEAVADFNSKNDGITITIHDYYEENINDGISRLYDDILTGKGPDIISFSTDEMDVEVLREKGAIENLIPYLEKSDVIGEEDIVDSAYHVLTADGGLYMLPTNFVLYTLITKEKWCSNKENFTFEEALRAVRECEEDPMISRDLFLQEGAICGGYSGETEDNRLEQYIKIAEQLPQQAMFQTNDLLMREGKIPFNLECIGDMQQYLYKKSVWGEDAVYTGFPGAEGKGRIFIFDNCFAINSQSTHKEEAWKFVESYFTEEGQKTIAPNWNFSILQDVLDQQLSDSRKQEYYQFKRSSGFSINNDALLMAEKQVGNFKFDGFLGGTIYYFQNDVLNAQTSGGLIIPGYYSLNASVDPAETSKSYNSKQVNSLYGKAALSWKSAVFLEFTGRNDWSSTLPKETRSYFYPSVAGSVVLSELLPMPEFLSFWKVRGSWTQTKNDMSIYAINDVYSISTDVWDNMTAAYTPNTMRNSLLSPSASRSYEFGTAIHVLNNRLRFDVTYYNKLKYNNTRSANLSPTSGYNSTLINMDEEQVRKGWEVTISGDIIKNKDLQWSATFNWSRDRYFYGQIDPVYSTQKPWVKEGERWDWLSAYDYQRDPAGNIIHGNDGMPLISDS